MQKCAFDGGPQSRAPGSVLGAGGPRSTGRPLPAPALLGLRWSHIWARGSSNAFPISQCLTNETFRCYFHSHRKAKREARSALNSLKFSLLRISLGQLRSPPPDSGSRERNGA